MEEKDARDDDELGFDFVLFFSNSEAQKDAREASH